MSDRTETLQSETNAASASGTRRRGSGLSGMVLAELQTMASGLGITGTARLRKSQLIEAIQAAQGSSAPTTSNETKGAKAADNGSTGGPRGQRAGRRGAAPDSRPDSPSGSVSDTAGSGSTSSERAPDNAT